MIASLVGILSTIFQIVELIAARRADKRKEGVGAMQATLEALTNAYIVLSKMEDAARRDRDLYDRDPGRVLADDPNNRDRRERNDQGEDART
ncbi:MAG: hypothetical protein H2045_09155 [Rhizobiales bacterium]|nr:hypothetical protein [Hyphomicrobiales bacterium]